MAMAADQTRKTSQFPSASSGMSSGVMIAVIVASVVAVVALVITVVVGRRWRALAAKRDSLVIRDFDDESGTTEDEGTFTLAWDGLPKVQSDDVVSRASLDWEPYDAGVAAAAALSPGMESQDALSPKVLQPEGRRDSGEYVGFGEAAASPGRDSIDYGFGGDFAAAQAALAGHNSAAPLGQWDAGEFQGFGGEDAAAEAGYTDVAGHAAVSDFDSDDSTLPLDSDGEHEEEVDGYVDVAGAAAPRDNDDGAYTDVAPVPTSVLRV